MKSLIFRIERRLNQQVQVNSKLLYDKYRIRYKWEGEDLLILPLKHDDIVLVSSPSDYAWAEWKVHVHMALKMKWLVQREDKSYVLGPYLRYECPYVTSDQGNHYKKVSNTELG